MVVQAQVAEQANQVKMAGHVIQAQTQENMQKREMGVPEQQLSGEQPAGMEQNIPEEEMV